MTIGQQQQRHRSPARERHNAPYNSAVIDLGESDLAALFELPGGEHAPEEHEVEILAAQADEFTCAGCFLVRHRSQLAREKNGLSYCRDCEG